MSQVTDKQVQRELQKLIGLTLVSTSRAADMRVFHFGKRSMDSGRSPDDCLLHVQCAWRIDSPEKVITGRHDLWQPAEAEGVDLEGWEYEQGPNLQDRIMAEWLGYRDSQPEPCALPTNRLVVLATRAVPFGGAEIDFTGGYRLSLFPCGSVGEDWRLFRFGNESPHFVVAGGQVEPDRLTQSTS